MRPPTNRTACWTPDSRSLAADIVTAVADRAGVDPFDLPQLHDAVDVDRLVEYIEYDQDGEDIVFPYAGYSVTLSPRGAIAAVPLSALVSPAAIASALAGSAVTDTARGWQWEPFSDYHSARYDRGEGKRTLVYGVSGEGAWIESDESIPVEA
jgi:hypothetical protein